MAAVTGVGTTYNLPNYHGMLFTVGRTDTPFLSAIGGINGAKVVHSKTWEWQTVDRRTPTVNNGVVEGAAAPTAVARSRANVSNITEIHQSKISVSYSKMGASGQFAGENVSAEWDDAAVDELTLQTTIELQSIAADVNQSFLTGTKVTPANNSSARATQGLLGAIATNLFANGGTNRALTADILNAALKTMYSNGAPLNDNTVLLVGPDQAVNINKVYSASAQLSQPTMDRTLGGMAIKTITTVFGTFGVLIDRMMPARQIAVAQLDACFTVFTEIPNKGLLFTEPLAKTGASDDYQLYGEVGLEYGPEVYHGLVKDLLNSDGS